MTFSILPYPIADHSHYSPDKSLFRIGRQAGKTTMAFRAMTEFLGIACTPEQLVKYLAKKNPERAVRKWQRRRALRQCRTGH